MNTQTRAILAYLRANPGGITPLEALGAIGCFRLGARIFDLKALGYEIATDRVTTRSGKRVARYRLVEQLEAGL